MKLSCSLLLCFLAGVAIAQDQNEEEDSVQVKTKKPDSLREKIYPRSVRLGTDVLALIVSGSSRFSGWEVNGDVDFGKFYVAVDYGWWGKNEKLVTGGDYSNQGSYWRAGADINLLKKDPDRNMFFFGIRYAHSSFSETVNIIASDPYFGPSQFQVTNPAATAQWAELVTGIRVRVWKELWIGLTSRMKFAFSATGTDAIPPYDVPGYGIVGQGIAWGFNYQLFWRIPIKKAGRGAKKLPVP